MFCEGLGAELVGFERFGVIMFFRKAPPQTEGRRDADPLIKTPPVWVIDVHVMYMPSGRPYMAIYLRTCVATLHVPSSSF